jgi:valyl-tRNA synthetase
VPIELPPQYDPKSVEKATYQKWLDARAFHATPDARPPEKRFSVVIPPPNVTGALHLGHAINGTIQDILTRYHRMKGDNTMWMPGIDHAGIATQAVVEKSIFEKEKKSRHDLGREELVRRIWEWKEQFGTRILSQLQSIGSSCDWDRTRFTLDDICAKAVREAFFKMFKDGLIFRGKRLVNWDTHLQTAVADDEIYHEEVKGQLTSIKYPVVRSTGFSLPPAEQAGDQEYLIVATTRPETMLGDTAVAVHPEDPRYKHLIGGHVIVPLVGRKIPIIADGQLVDPKFGTGVVKVTPAHDPNDYATGQRHNLEQINLLTPDGKVNENGQGEFLGKKYSYVGLKFATAARKQVLEDLETLGLIADKKVHEHEVGHSDRSKTPIEPYLSDQWFVRMGDIQNSERGTMNAESSPSSFSVQSSAFAPGVTLADGTRAPGLAQAAMDAVTSGRVKITPERYAKGYLDWLGQKRDWCISRQLWWGHRIPVWHKRVNLTKENYSSIVISKELCWTQDELDHASVRMVHVESGRILDDIDLWSNDLLAYFENRFGEWDIYVCVRADTDTHIFESAGFTRDPDVLDTWFSSALWPISTMGWPANGTSDKPDDQLLSYFYPTSLLSTAREILTLWVARMVIFGLYCKGDVPFRDVYIHAIIQDGEGRPMKKTVGNGVDPVDIVQSHGADALRFTLASMATETQDIRLPVQLVCPHCHERIQNNINGPVVIGCPKCKKQLTRPVQTAVGTAEAPMSHSTSDKFDIGRNFANKIWNASRFILSMPKSEAPTSGTPLAQGELADRWIMSRLNATVAAVHKSINDYRFADYAEAVRTFFWTDLCDWYLEIAKARIKAQEATVQNVLRHCLATSLQLLHPMMPFITEELWTHVAGNGSLLVTHSFPLVHGSLNDPAAEAQMQLVQAITSAIREIQNRYPAAKGKPIVLQPRDAATQALIEKSRGIIEPLTSAQIAENTPTAAKPENAAASVLPEVQIFIGGVIDKTAETAKLTRRRDELRKFIAADEGKLANEAFVSKAPEKIITGLRDQLAKRKEELTAVEKNLTELA